MTCQCVAFPTTRSPSISPIFGRRFSVYAASLAVSQHRGTPCSIPSFRLRVENSSIAAKAWASISLTCCRSFSSAHPFLQLQQLCQRKYRRPTVLSNVRLFFFFILLVSVQVVVNLFFTYVFWSTVTPTDILLFCASFFCLFQSLQESPVFGSTLRSLDYGY